ncbi:MAG: hypothetical protein WAN23_03245 [Candidatus Acidiferrales bacterium]
MGAVENIKEVADLVKKFNDIELNRRILKLEDEVMDLSREKRRADERVEELERALKFKEKLTFKPPFYWLEGDSAPYCPGCWESKSTAIHLVENPISAGLLQCPACKHVYGTF